MYLKQLLTALLLMVVLTSCEKKYYYYTNEKTPEQATNNKGNTPSDEEDNNNDERDDDGDDEVWAYVPSEVLQMTTGQDILLIGYVVGTSTSTSLKSAVYVPPFLNTTNLILADTLYQGVALPEDQQILVALTSPTDKAMRQQLNLQDHPELYNKQLLISGVVSTYGKRIAVKGVYEYQVME